MADIPSAVAYGKVEGYFTAASADSVADAGNVPDETPLEGGIVFTPNVRNMKVPTATPARDMNLRAVTAKVINGYLVPPDAVDDTEKGIHLVATTQTETSPTTVYWSVRFTGGMSVFPNISAVSVPPGGVLNLNTVVPASPEPGVVYVTYDSSMALNLAEDPNDPGTFLIGAM